MPWNKFIGITMLLYGLINPIGVIPIYTKLIGHRQSIKAHRIIVTASIAVACLLIAAALFGEQILTFFNVGLDDFRIAGGLLALFIAFQMFQAHYGDLIQTIQEQAEAEGEVHGIAVTPLAFPLLVGPAEMSVMITLSNDLPRFKDKALLVTAAILTTSLLALTLWMSKPISRLIGSTGINIATRVMALIVASVGVDFIITGLKNQFPGLMR